MYIPTQTVEILLLVIICIAALMATREVLIKNPPSLKVIFISGIMQIAALLLILGMEKLVPVTTVVFMLGYISGAFFCIFAPK